MKTERVPVAILVGERSGRQGASRQIGELRTVASGRGWEVAAIVEQNQTGDPSDARSALERVLELAGSGRIEKVLAHDVGRAGRRNSIILQFLKDLHAAGVSFYWHAQEVETLLPNGEVSTAGSIVLALLDEMARVGSEMRRKRVLDGLERARRRGKVLGRPAGTTDTPEMILERYAQVVRRLEEGLSLRETARLAGVSQGTVQRVKKAMRGETGGDQPEAAHRSEPSHDQLPVELL